MFDAECVYPPKSSLENSGSKKDRKGKVERLQLSRPLPTEWQWVFRRPSSYWLPLWPCTGRSPATCGWLWDSLTLCLDDVQHNADQCCISEIFLMANICRKTENEIWLEVLFLFCLFCFFLACLELYWHTSRTKKEKLQKISYFIIYIEV